MSASVTLKDSGIKDSTYCMEVILNAFHMFHLESIEFKDITYESCGCNILLTIDIKDGTTEMKDCTFEFF
jgi:hypothetical protein